MADYDGLKSDIQSWVEDDGSELSAALDTIIDLAELRLSQDLDLPAQTVHSTSTIDASDTNSYLVTIPGTAITVRHLKVVGGGNLEQRTLEWVNEVFPDRTSTGTPAYYARWDDNTLIVAPTPASDTDVELSYKTRIPALTASNTTNWYTTNLYHALLYACLVEAESFNKNYAAPDGDGQGQTWEQRYQQTLQASKRELARMFVDEAQGGRAI